MECVEIVKTEGFVLDSWSVGNTKRILPNDRFYLMQLGRPSRGLVGAGYFSSKPCYDTHWNGVKGAETLYCQIEFNQLVNFENEYLVSHEQLKSRFPDFKWTPQKSGNSIPLEIADKLDEMLGRQISSYSPVYEEGAQRRVMSNRIERSPQARAACLAKHGFNCAVCDFNFGEFYGEAGEGLIHVHHLKPLSATQGARTVNPVQDLIPVCANCHAVIHRTQEPLRIEKMRSLIRHS